MAPGKICVLLALSLCAGFAAAFGAATAPASVILAADPELVFEDGFEAPPPVNQPPLVDAGGDQTITLPAAASLAGSAGDDGLPLPPGALTTTWTKFSGPGNVNFDNAVAAATTATFSVDGVYVLRLTASDGALAAFDDVQITVNPVGTPPVLVPSEVDPTVATTLFDSTQFLYTGPNPVQTGVAPGTIRPRRGSVLRGRVLDRDELPLAGVTVAVYERPEFGQTQTRDDGWYDLAVNGGEVFTVNYLKPGFLPLQRTEPVEWREYVTLPDVVMIPLDPLVTAVAANAPDLQVHQGTVQSDDDGERRATLLFPAGTGASMVMGDGSLQPLAALDVRATEYTVGPGGPAAMPGLLPPTSGYTYAVELSVDQALDAGAVGVEFTQQVPVYVDNFLDFPAGTVVPAGYYDRAAAQWVAMPNGLVIKLVSVTLGAADLDIDGDDVADDPDTELAPLGITQAEREQLATLFDPGQSFWRTPAQHFSAWDYNWPRTWPDDATGAGTNGVASNESVNECLDEAYGSIIECQNQILGQSVGITGTPYTLNYRSDRVPGWEFGRTIDVAASGPAVPASLQRIEVQVEVAGQQLQQVLPPQPGQQAKFVWDGKDAYGRTLQGRHSVKGSLDFVYDAVYVESPEGLAAAFAQIGTTPISADPAREEVRFPQDLSGQVSLMDARALGVGGWTLSIHHSYDPNARTLYLGSGERISAEHMPMTLSRATRSDNALPADGLTNLVGLAVAPDGGFYFINDNSYDLGGGGSRIYHADTAGLITLVAGSGEDGDTGDGGPALAAGLVGPHSLALGPDGSLYVATSERIRRIDPAGIITTVAGGGATQLTTGGIPASSAYIHPEQVVVAADGTIFYSEPRHVWGSGWYIFRLGTDGTLSRYAGGGSVDILVPPPVSVPALDADLLQLTGGIAVDADGNLYALQPGYEGLVRIDPQGMLTTTAITYGGDLSTEGWPAIGSNPGYPFELSFAPDGALITAEKDRNRVRRIELNGVMTTIAGGGSLSTILSWNLGIPAPAADLRVINARVAPDGSLILMEHERHIWHQPRQQLLRARGAMPDPLGLPYTIASPAGDLLHQFDAQGRHLRTRHALTGSVLYEFGYDGTGRLTSVTEKTGGTDNITQIQRDGAGQPTVIVAPFGQVTELEVDANGFIDRIENPANEAYTATYTPGGLMQTFTRPGNRTAEYQHETDGRLKRVDDAADGYQTMARTAIAKGHQVTRTTALGVATAYQVENPAVGQQRLTTTAPDASQWVVDLDSAGAQVETAANGTVGTYSKLSDPRFGMQAAFVSEATVTLPSALTLQLEATRAASLSDPENVLSLVSLSEQITVAGRTTTLQYGAGMRTLTEISPENRLRTRKYDLLGRLVSDQYANLEPVTAGYTPRGQLEQLTVGSGPGARESSFGYGADGYLASATDPLGRTAVLERDAAGRVIIKTLPGGLGIGFDYDAVGDLVGITPPGRPAHAFSYNARGQLTSITPPFVAGTGATTFTYNDDRQLTTIARPGDEEVIFTYDAAGRQQNVELLEGGATLATYDMSYLTASQLDTITGPGAQTVTWQYDGDLITGVDWGGVVTGGVSWAYDNAFRVVSESVDGGETIAFSYDDDDLLIGAGDLVVTRDLANGLAQDTILGLVSDSWAYNGTGEVTGNTVVADALEVYAVSYTRDDLSRITQKVETIGGVTDTYDYDYDARGQLVEVQKNNVVVESYGYDDNGNRSSAEVYGVPAAATYDNQDRLLDYAGSSYAHTPAGRLLTRTAPGNQVTSYDYDGVGNLRGVILPNGTEISYGLDGPDRRVQRAVNGTISHRWLYDGILPVAELDADGLVVSQFVYADGNVPVYLRKGGVSYRIVTDQVGSVRLVIDAASGAIVQRIDYDSFGKVIADNNPGFQPFGFAGGIYDPATGLTRFGARDYDPEVGRWTAKDPVGFAGGDSNLYRYVNNNPVNGKDAYGLDGWDVAGGFLTSFAYHVQDLNPMISLQRAVESVNEKILDATLGSDRFRTPSSEEMSTEPWPGADPADWAEGELYGTCAAAAIGLAAGLRGLSGGRTAASSGLSYAEKLAAARSRQMNFGKMSEAAANARNANNPAFRPSAPVKGDTPLRLPTYRGSAGGTGRVGTLNG